MDTQWQAQLHEMYTASSVQQALAFIHKDHERTVQEQVALTEIPAPAFQEQKRGAAYAEKLKALGLEGVRTDSVGNVFGIRRGHGKGPTVVVCAHLDTVFPEGTDVTVKHIDGKLYAPGISDDGRGLTVVLAVLRALQQTGIQTIGDLVFGATVGEEGVGDLRGVKALCADSEWPIDGFLSIEPGSPRRTTYLATGSHRYKVTYRGPGGHSFGDFGTPSAIHALGRAVARIADVVTPNDPKTTFTVGEISGGTSVNTIAQEASMLIDLRSNDETALATLETDVLAILRDACTKENERWQTEEGISVQIDLIGDRPAGQQSAESVIVQVAGAAAGELGLEPALDGAQSTDANVPIALGIPAVTLGGGGGCGGMHTLAEYFDPTGAHIGVQRVLLTVLGLVGVEGVIEPLLGPRLS
ncbi:MAG: M20/M25/M40 family metallo-hydrolase [Firmicutes bacterium]|nr:M20/M25/M40 family metallo-hydrolase [Bacillota bacterium]